MVIDTIYKSAYAKTKNLKIRKNKQNRFPKVEPRNKIWLCDDR